MLVRDTGPQNKLSANYKPGAQTVIFREGSEIVLEGENGSVIRRNVSFAKPLLGAGNKAGGNSSVVITPKPNQPQEPPLRISARAIKVPDRFGAPVSH